MPNDELVSQTEAKRSGANPRVGRLLFLTSFLCIAVAVGIGYSRQSNAASAEASGAASSTPHEKAATVLAVKHIPIPRSVLVVGRVAPRETTPVLVPRIDLVVAKLNVSDGDVVKAGDVLAELDSRFSALELRQTELLLREAQIQAVTASDRFELSKSALRRASDTLIAITQLVETGAAAPGKRETAALEVEQAETEYSIAASDLDRARNDVELAQVAVERARLEAESHLIRASADGRIFGLALRAGEFPDATGSAATIMTGNDLDVVVEVPIAHLPELTEGAEVTLRRDEGDPLVGMIREVPVGLSEGQGFVAVKVALEQQSGMVPGMSVIGELVIGVEDGILVPFGAIARRGGAMVAMRVAADGTVEEVVVRLGEPGDDGRVSVLEGLAEGDVIIAQGADHYVGGDNVSRDLAEQFSAASGSVGMSVQQ